MGGRNRKVPGLGGEGEVASRNLRNWGRKGPLLQGWGFRSVVGRLPRKPKGREVDKNPAAATTKT